MARAAGLLSIISGAIWALSMALGLVIMPALLELFAGKSADIGPLIWMFEGFTAFSLLLGVGAGWFYLLSVHVSAGCSFADLPDTQQARV